MDLGQSLNKVPGPIDAGTAGFKDLTSQQVAMGNDQFKMDNGPNPYAAGNDAQINSNYAAAGVGGVSKSFGTNNMQYGFRSSMN